MTKKTRVSEESTDPLNNSGLPRCHIISVNQCDFQGISVSLLYRLTRNMRKLASFSYLKSNRATKARVKISPDAKFLAGKLLGAESDRRREFYADAIVNDLCESAGVPACHVSIQNRPQAHRKNSRGVLRIKTLGHYTPRSATIVVFNKTAIQHKVVAGKTFLRCLIHEFIHHYDYHKLHINSLHTAGFYQRVKGVYDALTHSG